MSQISGFLNKKTSFFRNLSNKSFVFLFFTTFFAFLISQIVLAQAKTKIGEYRPTISGYVLSQIQFDSLISGVDAGVNKNNGHFYIEPNLTLQFDENWSVKTQWRAQSNNVLTTRDPEFPERYRTFQSKDRKIFNVDKTGLLVEELKINFENEDLRFYLGKFDPTFGTAHRKSKRIGVFASQFAEDYNLREKIGGGVVALLEGAQIHIDTFFNDSTGLSASALNNRGSLRPANGHAGNTGTISSYAISVEGEDFFSVKNWFYNFGYRSQGVKGGDKSARETGYVLGSEYLYKLGRETSLIPFFEFVQFKNFYGYRGNNARYNNLALILRFRSWNLSVSDQRRKTQNQFSARNTNDILQQVSIGYKFNENLAVDVSRAKVKESGENFGAFGVNFSYLYKF